MSLSFVVNVFLVIISVWAAYDDHGEALSAVKSAPEIEKPKKRRKLIFLWGTPILSIALLPLTIWDSVSSSKEIGTLTTNVTTLSNQWQEARTNLDAKKIEVESISNRMVFAESEVNRLSTDLEAQRNPTSANKLKTLLDAIDLKIMTALTNGATDFHGMISDKQKQELKNLATDPDLSEILTIKKDSNSMNITPDDGTMVSVRFSVSTNLIKLIYNPKTAGKPEEKPN